MSKRINEKMEGLMRVSKKMLLAFADKIAYVTDSLGRPAYHSRINDKYITSVQLLGEKNCIIKLLLKRGITENVTNNMGYNPDEKKWYGWSHRAMYGFTIGSTCSKGDCHYLPKNTDDFIHEAMAFWESEYIVDMKAVEIFKADGNEIVKGVEISHEYSEEVPNKNLIGTTWRHFRQYPEKWGRGEWVAETMDDAKEMAEAFARGVS